MINVIPPVVVRQDLPPFSGVIDHPLVGAMEVLIDETGKVVFATNGYSQSVKNLAQTSLKTDNVFSDGVSLQTPTMTGSTSAGYERCRPFV